MTATGAMATFNRAVNGNNVVASQQASNNARIKNNFYGTGTTAYKNLAQACRRNLYMIDRFDNKEAFKYRGEEHARDTCEWIFNTPELRAWFDFEKRLLCLYGNHGTGKSTMANFLTQNLLTSFTTTKDKTIASFFCDSSSDARKTATSILRGLMHQLTEKHPKLLDYLLPQYRVREAEIFRSFDGLWDIFIKMSSDQTTGKKYFIIDALDECDQEAQRMLFYQLRKTFLGQSPPPNIQLLITTRPHIEIREALNGFPKKDLASFPQVQQDIELYIQEKMADFVKRKSYTAKVEEKISKILRGKAENTFLWVGFACTELEKVLSKDAVSVLQNLPEGLRSLYKRTLDEILQEMDSARRMQFQRVLSFLAICLQPFSIIELADACQLHQDEEDVDTRIQFTLDEIAAYRLMIITEDQKVFFLHQSVKDFLVGPELIISLTSLKRMPNLHTAASTFS